MSLSTETNQTLRNLKVEQAVFSNLQKIADAQNQSVDELASELLTQAIEQRQQADTTEERWWSLSHREQEIIALHCLGYSSHEIGLRLTLSLNTIKSHLRNGMQKLGFSNRSELRKALADWDFAGWLKVEPKARDGYLQAYLPLPGFNNGRKRRI
jgi:DNA-binding NarL/FixJ family response regulator